MQTEPKISPAAIAVRGLKNLLTEERLNRIYNLKFRWADEREYEDFADYKAAMKKIFDETSFELVDLKKTFEVKLRCVIRDVIVTAKFTVNGYQLSAGTK